MVYTVEFRHQSDNFEVKTKTNLGKYAGVIHEDIKL